MGFVFSATAQNVKPSLGALDGHGFGYEGGMLVYYPWFSPTKTVDFGQQQAVFKYKCSALLAGTEHVATVSIVTSLNPSKLWESDFHRFTAIYGGLADPKQDKNIVTKSDLNLAAKSYVGKESESLCDLVSKKSLKDLLRDTSLGQAASLNEKFEKDLKSPFEFQVQSVKAELPEELLRALALKGIEKPAPKVAYKKPAPQSCCCPLQ